MFDRLRKKATRAVKRVAGDAVEDEAEKQTQKQIDKHRGAAQAEYEKSTEHSFRGMKEQKKKVTGEMITDFKKFKASWEKNASDPAQSIFHFLIAAYNYSVKDKAIGDAMATVILSKKHNLEDPSTPSGLKLGPTNKTLLKYMRNDPNIVKSYLGAEYKEDYKFNESKPKMAFLGFVPEGEKRLKAIIQSTGKDFPTPVGLAKNKNGQWKITEFSSIATGCKKPASEEDDF
ncbi:MAG: hypothetical protein KGD59_01570 [Candidatus Heimdallarchaeota archaeon]|nr:hypothetical protein [Candidatus Heimdallarchaeota archaeon]MBY8993209.1 hypothetical protein [Candidatus Heimdallarchaeota archaeon]